jgi:predicted PurR-regulated permease PerM
MDGRRRRTRPVIIPPATALRIIAVAVGTVVLLIALERARTILELIIIAGATALLLDGPVQTLTRWLRRGFALALVVLVGLAFAGLVAYGVAHTVVNEYHQLQAAAPRAAEQIATSPRLADLARRAQLVVRTKAFVDAAPGNLIDDPVAAARAATTRLGEFLLVASLTVIMLVELGTMRRHVVSSGSTWLLSPGELSAGLTDGARTARYAVARAMMLGGLVAVAAAVAGIPGAAVLGVWMAWWRLLPLLGLLVGYAPLVLLLGTEHPAWVTLLTLLALAAAEVLVLRLDRARPRRVSLVPMASASALAVFAGFEWAGAVGSVVTVVVAHIAVGVLRAAVRTGRHPVPGAEPAAGAE